VAGLTNERSPEVRATRPQPPAPLQQTPDQPTSATFAHLDCSYYNVSAGSAFSVSSTLTTSVTVMSPKTRSSTRPTRRSARVQAKLSGSVCWLHCTTRKVLTRKQQQRDSSSRALATPSLALPRRRRPTKPPNAPHSSGPFDFLELPVELQLECFEHIWPEQTIRVPSFYDAHGDAGRMLLPWSTGLNTVCSSLRKRASEWLSRYKTVVGTISTADILLRRGSKRYWNPFYTSFRHVHITLRIDMEFACLEPAIRALGVRLVIVMRRFSHHPTQLTLSIAAYEPQLLRLLQNWRSGDRHLESAVQWVRVLAAIPDVLVVNKVPASAEQDDQYCRPFHAFSALASAYHEERERIQQPVESGTAVEHYRPPLERLDELGR